MDARKPEWLKVKSNMGEENIKMERLLRSLALHTVCEEAGCPNCGECFQKGTATFMILGRNCTRSCTFCAVTKCQPEPPDPQEPKHIADAVKKLNLRHVVITSVTRDDLPDGGASHFAKVIDTIKKELGETCPVIEVLIPDLNGNWEALQVIITAKPDIINHNVETVPRLYPEVRPQADYQRSLELIQTVKQNASPITTKSGIMLGLGETHSEVIETLGDLRNAGCDILTIGQYLAPSKQHHPVIAFIHPDEFAVYKSEAEEMGFLYVASGPLIRSSYGALEAYEQSKEK
ncbi:MAG: lipoyl synthase [Eubacteriales bacterium]